MQVIPRGHVVLACAPEGARDQGAHQRQVHRDLRQKTAVLERDVALPHDRLAQQQVADRGDVRDRRRLGDGELAARDLLSHVSRDGVVFGDRVSELRQLPCGFILILRRIPVGDRGERSQAVRPRPCGRGGDFVSRPEPRRDINCRGQQDKHDQRFFHMTLGSRAGDPHGQEIDDHGEGSRNVLGWAGGRARLADEMGPRLVELKARVMGVRFATAKLASRTC